MTTNASISVRAGVGGRRGRKRRRADRRNFLRETGGYETTREQHLRSLGLPLRLVPCTTAEKAELFGFPAPAPIPRERAHPQRAAKRRAPGVVVSRA